MRNCFLIFFAITLIYHNLFAQKITTENQWVDSVYQTLNDTQRIGQLVMIRAHSNRGDEHIEEVENLIKKYYVGSLCFSGVP